MTNPGYKIDDIIRVAFGEPLDALAQADIEPAIAEQVRPATSEELEDIEKLAKDAAQLQDEIRDAAGDRAAKLRKIVADLKLRLLKHGMTEIEIPGRPPLELTTKKTRKPTRKSIVAVFQKEHGTADGAVKAFALWAKIPQTTSYGIAIPEPTPTEMDSSY